MYCLPTIVDLTSILNSIVKVYNMDIVVDAYKTISTRNSTVYQIILMIDIYYCS